MDNRQRLDKERSSSRITELHFALQRLKSVVSFMNTGAHPDDETSAMLATLGQREGFDISYACANRGEGGQNDIGTESQAVLGTLRTAEMEKAASSLNLRLYWLSESPSDAIYDFGFSKSGEETLNKWGYERTLERFVHIVRREKPDIICPTFLDIPGQHGHHRAMTLLAHEIMRKSKDPTFTTGDLAPWTIKKLYLPAWGGGGTAYDDELPPPPASLTIFAKGCDQVSGWSWENIGQHSRRFHVTQNMGRWVNPHEERDWQLHLAQSNMDASLSAEPSLTSGLICNLEDMAQKTSSPELKEHLTVGHEYLQKTIAEFPDFDVVINNAVQALTSIHKAIDACPTDEAEEVLHRLVRKKEQLSYIICIASGVNIQAIAGQDYWQAGDSCTVELDLFSTPENIKVTLVAQEPWTLSDNILSLNRNAQPTNPYPDTWLPGQQNNPTLQIDITHNGVLSTTYQPLQNPPIVIPDSTGSISPAKVLFNTLNSNDPVTFTVSGNVSVAKNIELLVDEPWTYSANGAEILLHPPSALKTGLYNFSVKADGKPVFTSQQISYPHIDSRALSNPIQAQVLALELKTPDVSVVFIGSGNDSIDTWLEMMGIPVTCLNESDLQDTKTVKEVLNAHSTLVIGQFAYRFVPSLKGLVKLINEWVALGGHLVTMYHRPWDDWNPETIPPYFLEIGQPSLRYRVTDENATVQHLLPDHKLVNYPNKITQLDWQGWHKERGLYFAKSWDERYELLLSMADPGEEAHLGSLLCASVGKGQHIHTSLILNHQMSQLVPGAFRLMANIVA